MTSPVVSLCRRSPSYSQSVGNERMLYCCATGDFQLLMSIFTMRKFFFRRASLSSLGPKLRQGGHQSA